MSGSHSVEQADRRAVERADFERASDLARAHIADRVHSQRDDEATWASRLLEGRVFPSFDAVLLYLSAVKKAELGRSMRSIECSRVYALAREFWPSHMAPVEAPLL